MESRIRRRRENKGQRCRALPAPPSQTFLEHLHSLNILAEVEKKGAVLCSAPVMFVQGNKFGFNKSPRQEPEVIATFFKKKKNLFPCCCLFYPPKQGRVEVMLAG